MTDHLAAGARRSISYHRTPWRGGQGLSSRGARGSLSGA